jgi:3-phenylpropionate/trans-cinnamate dioxygenase ferredoxin subunit
MSSRFAVARVSDVPDGERLIVDVDGRSVGVFNVAGRYHALLNRCPHAGGELCRGELLGLLESDTPGEYHHDPTRKLLACPWHGWEFDLETGQSYFDPARTRVRRYGVVVEQGEALAEQLETGESRLAGELVPGPYVAETIPIAVEDDYLVVTLRAS